MAIEELNCSVVLDEVKLDKGHVRRFFGHKGTTLVMWHGDGRAFSTQLHTVDADEVTHETHKRVSESSYDRDKVYDLKFE